MRILIIGASGLIGSAIAARLSAQGHRIVGVARHAHRTYRTFSALGAIEWATVDISRAVDASSWRPLLKDIDAVINVAGTLQDSPSESTEGVHVTGISALYEACQQENVAKVIHFSAIGADRGATQFSRSKQRGEQALASSDLNWIILRPSVVIGRSAYGGSALLRSLAALPVLPVMPGTGKLQPVHLDDVVETIPILLKPDAPSRQILDVVGPRRYEFPDLVDVFRRWMRWRPARRFELPAWAATLLYRLGDAAVVLGWKPPVRSTAQREMHFGAVGDPKPWEQATGLKARDIEHELMREPASVQERWFARLYVPKPLVFAVFGAFWIVTGLISLGPGWEIGTSYVREGGLGPTVAAAATIAGALADIAIGLAILYRPTARYGLYAALLISIAYAIIGTILVPGLWIDPLGPMLKIFPIMAFNLVALAIVDDR